VLDTNEAAVLNAWSGATPGKPRLRGRCGWARWSAYSPSTLTKREGEQGARVLLPSLVRLRVDTHQVVEGALHARVVLARLDAGHVRTKGAGSGSSDI